MTSRFGRGLRRFVDTLQRGLFDEAPETTLDPAPVDPTPADPTPADPTWRHPQATREIVIDGRRIAFRLVRVRRRSIGFVVDGHGLTVRVPKWVALRDVDLAVREKQGWILARLAEQRERTARLAAMRVVWRDRAQVHYLGRPLTIVLDANGELGAGETALVAM
ncbi:MAG: M48 family metallopeptidase, partial [Pseudomonadota bacterium]|nr:M48 family metallopeptidase [Pseudomonadota bacterium]